MSKNQKQQLEITLDLILFIQVSHLNRMKQGLISLLSGQPWRMSGLALDGTADPVTG